MRCRAIQRRLDAFQKGELVGSAAVKVGAHLSACDACRTVLCQIDRLNEACLALDAAAPSLPGSLNERLNSIPSRTEVLEEKTMKKRNVAIRFGFATALTLALTVALVALPRRDASATYASMVKALKTITSMHMVFQDSNGGVTETWASPTLYRLVAEGYTLEATPDGGCKQKNADGQEYECSIGGPGFWTMEGQVGYLVFGLNSPPKTSKPYLVGEPFEENGRTYIQLAVDAEEGAGTFNGQPLPPFRVIYTIEKETQLPVRLEAHQLIGGEQVFHWEKDIEYNVPIPAN